MNKEERLKQDLFVHSLVQTHYSELLRSYEVELVKEKRKAKQQRLVLQYKDILRAYYNSCMDMKKSLENWFDFERDNDMPRVARYKKMYKDLQKIQFPEL